MPGLFDMDAEVAEQLRVPDADIVLLRNFLAPDRASEYFRRLHAETPWREEDVYVWGKWHKQPRLVSWHGEPGAAYTYSGSTLQPNGWTATLLELRASVESAANATLNSVLLNLYRDQKDGMGWHSDDERELGEAPTIASLSLGAPRLFQLKHKTRGELGVRSVELPPGSLLIMRGQTQRFWSHSVRKESRAVGPRINLTFRHIFALH